VLRKLVAEKCQGRRRKAAGLFEAKYVRSRFAVQGGSRRSTCLLDGPRSSSAIQVGKSAKKVKGQTVGAFQRKRIASHGVTRIFLSAEIHQMRPGVICENPAPAASASANEPPRIAYAANVSFATTLCAHQPRDRDLKAPVTYGEGRLRLRVVVERRRYPPPARPRLRIITVRSRNDSPLSAGLQLVGRLS